MPKNRVHELEETVEELKGKIDGLTVELVDVKKRLEKLEGTHEEDPSVSAETNGQQQEESSVESDGSDIIIC